MENPSPFKLYMNIAVVGTVYSTYKAKRESCYNWLNSSLSLQFCWENSVQCWDVGCQGPEDTANSCFSRPPSWGSPHHARGPSSSPRGHQSLPQRCHIRASLQVPTVLPCLSPGRCQMHGAGAADGAPQLLAGMVGWDLGNPWLPPRLTQVIQDQSGFKWEQTTFQKRGRENADASRLE